MNDFPIIEKLAELLCERGFLKGRKIAWHCHLTSLTAKAAEAVHRAGAELVFSECNGATTEAHALASLAAMGEVHLGPDSARKALATRPALIADTGFSMSEIYFSKPGLNNCELIGVSEITTSGIVKLRALLAAKADFRLPVININDGKLKTCIENFHGVGDGVVEILKDRLPELAVTVVGYGAVGAGCARHLKEAGAAVCVVEVDGVRALIAHYDGYALTDLDSALEKSDVLVTATGQPGLIGKAQWQRARNGLTVLNVGHDPGEVSPHILKSMTTEIRQSQGGLSFYRLNAPFEKVVSLYTEGSPANVALLTGSEEPTLIHLTTEILAWDYLLSRQASLPEGEIIIPYEVEERAAYLALRALGEPLAWRSA